jgi:glutathione S-transferase
MQHEFAGLSLEPYPSVKKWVTQVAGLPEIKAAYEKVPQGSEP